MDAALEIAIRPELQDICDVDCDTLWVRLDPFPVAIWVTGIGGNLKRCDGLAEEQSL